MHSRYRVAEQAMRDAQASLSSLCEPLQQAFRMDGAAISTFDDPFGAKLVCASDDDAARFGEAQIDLGEGPAWDAFHQRRPVVGARLENGGWPALAGRMHPVAIGSVFAFPLVTGDLRVGALCLHSQRPRELEALDLQAVATLAPLAASAVLTRAMRSVEHPDDEQLYSLREVHQATGMVAAQLGVSADDALVAIRAHAFSSGRPVRAVAADIVARRTDLSRD